MLDREELGKKIYQVSRDHGDAYLRNISKFNSDQENDCIRKCSCAASNTGFFLLQALGYVKEDMDRFRELTGTANHGTSGSIM